MFDRFSVVTLLLLMTINIPIKGQSCKNDCYCSRPSKILHQKIEFLNDSVFENIVISDVMSFTMQQEYGDYNTVGDTIILNFSGQYYENGELKTRAPRLIKAYLKKNKLLCITESEKYYLKTKENYCRKFLELPVEKEDN